MTLTLSRDAETGSPVRTIAAKYGVSEETVRNWITQGVVTDTGRVRLRAVRVAGSWRITPEHVEVFLRHQNDELANVLGDAIDPAGVLV